MGLNAHLLAKTPLDHDPNTFQKVPTLRLDYGRTLRENLMSCDPFYTLSEVFGLAASSEKQFLNLVELKLEKVIQCYE